MRHTRVLGLFQTCFFLVASFATAAPPVKLQGLPVADFEKLPPDAQLDVGGRILTKSQLLSELVMKKQLAVQNMPKSDFASAKAKFLADEKARLESSNAAIRSRWQAIAGDAAAVQGGPRIESIEGQPVRSGGDILIRGSGFGGAPFGTPGHLKAGDVQLLGPFPGGHLTFRTCGGGIIGNSEFVNCNWKPRAIQTIDNGLSISGIPDQQLQVVVVTHKGERSAPFPVAFRAKRILQQLTAKDVSVLRSNPAEGPCGLSEAAPSATISCAEGYDGSSPSWHIGVDRVSAKLHNGWTFDSGSSVIVRDGGTSANVQKPFGYEIGQLTYEADRTTANVTCTYFSVGLVRICAIDLWVVGPEGIPMQ